MRQPDGPSGPRELAWAPVIKSELNSWDPRRLSPRFEPRPRQVGVLRPLPVALFVLIMALLAATALAGGPRALGTVIGSLSTHSQPSPTPVTPHASRAVLPVSTRSASGAVSGAATISPAARTPDAASAAQPARSGTPAGQGQPQGAGAQALPPQVQLPVGPQQTQLPQMPPLPTPAFPRLPTLPPVPQMPPAPGGAPTPPPTQGTGPPPPTPGVPIPHPVPAPTNGQSQPDVHPTSQPTSQPGSHHSLRPATAQVPDL